MNLADLYAELDSRNLRLERTRWGTLRVIGEGELSPELAAALRRYRGELMRLVPVPPPIRPPDDHGWQVGDDSKIIEGPADWHADVLGWT